MNKPKVYIVEDEPIIVITIKTILEKAGYEVVGDADNVSSAQDEILKYAPDLVVLDIELDGNKDGVDLAIQLERKKTPYLYLTAQTDPLTIKKVKQTNPLGYIVKPFTESSLRSNIELAWHNYIKEIRYFVFKTSHEVHKIKQSDIVYLKAFDNYCYLFTKNEKHLIPKTLKYIHDQLDNTLFVKTHRSYVINSEKVTSVDKDTVYLNNDKVPLSKTFKPHIKDIISAFINKDKI